MSTWSQREVACPTCAASVRVKVALGAHVGRAPQVRDQVLARTFHRFVCPAGHTITVHSTFEYMDIERRQLLLVGGVDDRARWPAYEARVDTTVDRVLHLGSPLTEPLVRELRSRVVFGLEELREKIVIWDAAIDDGLVECIKVRAYASDPALAAPGTRLVVDHVRDDDVLVCTWHPSGAVLEFPVHWLHDALRDRASLEARFPELFRGGYVSVDRLRAP